MANPEVDSAWKEAKQRTASADADKVARIALRKEISARKDAAVKNAQDIINQGAQEVEQVFRVEESRSDYVPLGVLDSPDADGRDHAFAVVWITRQKDLEKVRKKGWFFERTVLSNTPTEKVREVGVALYAGTEEMGNLMYFDDVRWSITEEYPDTSQIEALEAQLAVVGQAAGTVQPAAQDPAL